MHNFNLFSNPKQLYKDMLKEINNSKKYIFLETYIYDNDSVGRKFLDVLIKKAKEGVKVRLLLDAWGSSAKKDFFKKLIAAGGEVRFFREFQYVFQIFSKNHERNHRKLLVIDNNFAYIGSANITESCLDWHELVLKIDGDITPLFAKSFSRSWDLHSKLSVNKLRTLVHERFEILNDVPSNTHRITEKKYLKLIKKAKKKILIETPYFIPSTQIRKALAKAVKKHVEVIIILPEISDVKVLDISRNIHLGWLYENGIKIYYYPKPLHSKLLIIDADFFLLGSSNLDYRSFIHQFEINFIGKDKRMIQELKNDFHKTFSISRRFNFKEWKNRSSFKKFLEVFLNYFKHLL